MAEIPETKECQFCGGEVKAIARKCKHCGEYLDDDERNFMEVEDEQRVPTTAEAMMIPVGRSGWAIAAGYCGLLGLFPICGIPFVLGGWVTGLVALNHLKTNPKLLGAGRAWFGIISGGVIGLIINVLTLVGLGINGHLR